MPTTKRLPRKFVSELLDAAAMVCLDEFERGDPFAPFHFAALYVRFGGRAVDIPDWVGDHFLSVAGEWALARQAGTKPARTLDEFAGFRRKKFWKKREDDASARVFMCLFERLTQRAREGIEARGSPYAKRLGRDGRPYPIPENEYTDGQERCAIIDVRDQRTSKFQVMLARQCGIPGNSDRAIYGTVLRIRRRHTKEASHTHK